MNCTGDISTARTEPPLLADRRLATEVAPMLNWHKLETRRRLRMSLHRAVLLGVALSTSVQAAQAKAEPIPALA